METAIKRAIEGGYDEHKYDGAHVSLKELTAIVTSDPTFWQALGKAEGWDSRRIEVKAGESHNRGTLYKRIAYSLPVRQKNLWKKEWHHFIDCLAEGGDVEGFFKELLK